MLPKTVGYIQDICCFGKCSMTVGLPALAALGNTVVPMPTGLYSAHLGYAGHTKLDTSGELEKILAHYESMGLLFDSVISGFLSSPCEARLAMRARGLIKRGGLAIVDPVLGDSGKPYGGVNEDMQSAMKELCRNADLITPNVTEACMLLGLPAAQTLTAERAREILQALKAEYGVKAAVLTGCDLQKGLITTVSLDSAGSFDAHDEKKCGGRWHGCGDLFVAVAAGLLLNGRTLAFACAFAAKFIAECVRHTESLGLPEAEGLSFEPLLGLLADEARRGEK